jgi:hypothetical protein
MPGVICCVGITVTHKVAGFIYPLVPVVELLALSSPRLEVNVMLYVGIACHISLEGAGLVM